MKIKKLSEDMYEITHLVNGEILVEQVPLELILDWFKCELDLSNVGYCVEVSTLD